MIAGSYNFRVVNPLKCFVVPSQKPSLAQGELEARHIEVIRTDEGSTSPITKDAEVTNHKVLHMEEVISKAGDFR